MQSLGKRKTRPLRDPAPSKWGYRWQRWMLTPGVRTGLRIGLPVLVLAAACGIWSADPENRKRVVTQYETAKAAFQQRPEFMVTSLNVTGADPDLATQVKTLLPVAFPVSSFDLDLEAMRASVAVLDPVAEVRVNVGDAGLLNIEITPRVPVAVWRDHGALRMIDKDGVFAGTLEKRSSRRDLPLIAGEGAKDEIQQALRLFRAASPIASDVRGLVRVGARRWDMVLEDKQRIMLPTDAPTLALNRVVVLHQSQDLLGRDIEVVDMRNPDRPTIRMSKEAAQAMLRISQTGAEQ